MIFPNLSQLLQFTKNRRILPYNGNILFKNSTYTGRKWFSFDKNQFHLLYSLEILIYSIDLLLILILWICLCFISSTTSSEDCLEILKQNKTLSSKNIKTLHEHAAVTKLAQFSPHPDRFLALYGEVTSRK